MKLLKVFISRIFIFGMLIILQMIWIVLMTSSVLASYQWLNTALKVLSMAVVLWLVNKDENSSYKLSWIILIMVFPVFGGLLYLMIGNKKPSRRLRHRIQHVIDDIQDELIMEDEMSDKDEQFKKDGLTYLADLGFGTYTNTQTKYYALGDYCYVDLLRDIMNAKHYIFMEYFIVARGMMFETILELLKQKVQEGVEVRFIYDDVGSLTTVPYRFEKKLEQVGIQCVVFNPFVPMLSVAMNHRDHRKICVIDGYIGYSGGFNLADEYINAKMRFGHWKDTGIRIEGNGVWNLTTMFLTTWNAYKHQDQSYVQYRPTFNQKDTLLNDGYVVAYGDSPLDEERTGENIYLNMIQQAKHEILIMTPYFIIDETMMKALILARRKGVVVKIITPGVPDKKNVYRVTRSYYYPLIQEGIEFYEYKPGFLHAKMVLCDRRIATVGTINFDYRSLYLHFECNVLLTQKQTILDISKDFKETLALSEKIDLKYSQRFRGIYEAILRLFAPLM
ncbi:MAG: cardiolipin synthase [Coprobacillus cateniformis]|uniref:cardiolipin synthase n=1 Tax=Longibaculum muris TaxID=1796628 RepID=UPI003AB52B86|nr:cardiolipin synthase [Coprobacillus cateniformis]